MRVFAKWLLAGVMAVGSLNCGGTEPVAGEQPAVDQTQSGGDDIQADGRGAYTLDGPQSSARGGGQPKTNNLTYHGGPVMTGLKTIYYIWYGNWAGNTALTILPDLASNLGGSPYFNINSLMTNASGGKVDNQVAYGGSVLDAYSMGKALTDANLLSIVTNAINSGSLPADANAVYFVLTSADVNATSGFCTQYCGWHDHATIAGTDIKYSFVGNPDRCPSACEQQTAKSPNANPGADGMASILTHEFEEAASDPDLNAWYDRSGYENADKCAWTFGTQSTAANGSKYNITLGARQYLIQQNWVNTTTGKCAMSYP